MLRRYEAMFAKLRARSEGAYVPFVVLGDPSPDVCLEIVAKLIEGGADALELGLAFSDPIADGPTIQKANQRVLRNSFGLSQAWCLVSTIRDRFPDTPLGLLVYANLVGAENPEAFYRNAASAGVDSVLVADVPTLEAAPYLQAAEKYGIQPVFIAYPWANERHLRDIALMSRGYTYLVTRKGVTGAEIRPHDAYGGVIEWLQRLGAAPCLMGFGIAKPEHVKHCLRSGASGAICGSAMVRLIESHLDNTEDLLGSVHQMTVQMKAATQGALCPHG